MADCGLAFVFLLLLLLLLSASLFAPLFLGKLSLSVT